MGDIITLALVLGLCAASVAAWITNLVWTFGQTGGDLALGIVGVFVPFVGIFHGLYQWIA